jgi:hypothetical protein
MVSMLKNDGQLVCMLPISDYDKNSSIKLRQEFTKLVNDINNHLNYDYLKNIV